MKHMVEVPSLLICWLAMEVFANAVRWDGIIRLTSKVALIAGSSQQGNAFLASVGSNWVHRRKEGLPFGGMQPLLLFF